MTEIAPVAYAANNKEVDEDNKIACDKLPCPGYISSLAKGLLRIKDEVASKERPSSSADVR